MLPAFSSISPCSQSNAAAPCSTHVPPEGPGCARALCTTCSMFLNVRKCENENKNALLW